MKNRLKIFKNLVIVVLAIAMLIASTAAVNAAPGYDDVSIEDQLKTINVHFTGANKEKNSWLFPYDDALFELPDYIYNHKFAQMSLGMTVAAFRADYNENPYQDENILDYFKKTGFTNVEDESYKSEPTTTSISTAIAFKNLKGFTVLAIAICGQGYKQEWCSNLNVGDEERHTGFNEAAKIVEERVEEYIKKYNLTGDIVIWTSGFSRAAAVSNIVAADLTETRRFMKVFGYSFATPKTTRNPDSFNNIFCIIGKDDPVPQIPFVDWGYTHYGHELYTMSKEADENFNLSHPNAAAVYNEITGRKMVPNPELSIQMRTLFSYLYALIPDAKTYEEKLQPTVLEYFEKKEQLDDKFFADIVAVLSSFEPTTEEEVNNMKSLISFVELMGNQYVFKGNSDQKKSGAWDETLPMALNLFGEHMPTKYIGWMFSSDDPEKIFTSSQDFAIITLHGNADVYVYDTWGVVDGFNEEGKIQFAEEYGRQGDVNKPELYYDYREGQMIMCLPLGRAYDVFLENPGSKSEKLEVYISEVKGTSVDTSIIKAFSTTITDQDSVILFHNDLTDAWETYVNEDGTVEELIKQGEQISPDILMKIQNINFFHLSLGDILFFAVFLFVIFVVLIIISAIFGIIRAARHKKRRAAPAIISHILAAFIFFIYELMMWYFIPAIIWARLLFQVLCYFMIILLALKGEHIHKTKNKRIWVACLGAAMILACILESLFIGSFESYKVLIVFLVTVAFIVLASITWKAPKVSLKPALEGPGEAAESAAEK